MKACMHASGHARKRGGRQPWFRRACVGARVGPYACTRLHVRARKAAQPHSHTHHTANTPSLTTITPSSPFLAPDVSPSTQVTPPHPTPHLLSHWAGLPAVFRPPPRLYSAETRETRSGEALPRYSLRDALRLFHHTLQVRRCEEM